METSFVLLPPTEPKDVLVVGFPDIALALMNAIKETFPKLSIEHMPVQQLPSAKDKFEIPNRYKVVVIAVQGGTGRTIIWDEICDLDCCPDYRNIIKAAPGTLQ